MDEATARPFDASVILMAEVPDSAPSTWRTVSLAKFLRDALLTPPSQREESVHSRAKIVDALKALADRGLDGYTLARYGLGPKIADQIAGLASLPQLLNVVIRTGFSEEVEEILTHMPDEINPWSQLCMTDVAPRSTGDETARPEDLFFAIMELTHDWHSRVQTWAQQVDIEDLIGWECPTSEYFNALVESSAPENDLVSHYKWVVDRLTQTYLSDWEDSSLHHEYRWIRAAEPIPFPDSVMALRSISSEALNAEIAERAVMNQGDKNQRDTAAQLAFQGAQLVKSGNRHAAASTFHLVAKINPDDASARNDLGFALVPDEPRKALRHLSAAARMGYDQPFINAHNRMVCNILIGAPKEALYIAESTWKTSMTEQVVPAILWTQTDGQWIVQHVADARAEVADLGLQAARTLGGEAEEIWQSRLVSLSVEETAVKE